MWRDKANGTMTMYFFRDTDEVGVLQYSFNQDGECTGISFPSGGYRLNYSGGTGITVNSGTISYNGTTLWAEYSNGTLNLYDHDPNV